MPTAPEINYPDGSGITNTLVLTTNMINFSFTGKLDSSVVDVQININNSGWTSSPSMMELSLPYFAIPNSNSYPDGIELQHGVNVIAIRAINVSGAFSPVSTVTVTVISIAEFQNVRPSPTGIRLQRNADSIYIQWSDTIPTSVTGFNLYASTSQGGSGSGYLKINKELISSASPTKLIEEEFNVDEFSYTVDAPGTVILPNQVISVQDVVLADLVTTSEFRDATLDISLQTPIIHRSTLSSDLKFRITNTIIALRQNNFFSFKHDRNDGIGNGILNSDVFSIISTEDPLFYVITAVYFDKATGQLQESRYSLEIAGAPLPLDTTIRGIRIREQGTVATDYILAIQTAKPEFSLIPGSTVREVHVEPFSNEMQKAYFLMDFVHRSKSFAALLQIDDPGLTGTSIVVANSAYKQNLRASLSLSSDAAVQSLIDNAFDSLSGNFGVPRLGRRQSVVQQTFFTTIKPTDDLIVTQGAVVQSLKNSASPRFRSNGAAVLPAANAQAYYNTVNRRYEIKVQLIAETAGSIGNIPAGDLDTVVSGADGFKTINEESSDYGRDVQNNLELAETSIRKLSSLDTGTEGGYVLTSSSTPGVIEVRVVKSGDAEMMRDYDSVRGKHIGGKVDVWVKGTIERTVTETFAFQFDIARNVRFDVIDPVNFIFRARDSRLTVDNPIKEMLYNPSQGLGLRNHSAVPTTEYDLTGVEIFDYRTIKLSSVIPQEVTMLDDFIEGDYRYRSNNEFEASIQPIRRVTSISGEISGPIDSSDGFALYKTQDPLLEGDSVIAKDFITISQVNGIPSGSSISVNSEQHVLIGQFEEPLNSVGINSFTLHVYSADRSVEYNGPNTQNSDFLVTEGSQTTPLKIIRTTYSNITNGSTVSVDYEKDENFDVVYVVNDVLQRVQQRIDKGIDGGYNAKHITADVLVKQAVENPLLLEATVQLLPKANQGVTDSEIRTGLSVLADSRGVGGAVRQSDSIKVFEDATGLDFVVQPYTRHTLANGAMRIRDSVPSNYIPLTSLNKFGNAVFILDEPLPFDTIDGGGDGTIHHGVYIDELIMTMASSLQDVSNGVNKSWIISRLGEVISGYSDDDTLLPDFVTTSAIAAERVRRTANKIVISLDATVTPPDIPSNHSFSATYTVHSDRGVKDITTSQVEYLTAGDVTITYRA